MNTKRMFQLIVVVAILVTTFASTGGGASAWSGCASYITVQWGDTLSGIAALCATTVEAIRAANPGLGWWLYAGQVLYIPTGYTYAPSYTPSYPTSVGTYVVQWGDTLGKIAARKGVSVSAILAVNPQIWNASWIYAGQIINLPGTAYVPPPYVPTPVVAPPVQAPNFDGQLTVIAAKGVNIRNQPNYDGKILLADDYTKGVTFNYRKNSVTKDDAHRRIWVEVVISQYANGYNTGWLPVSGPQDYLNHTGPIEDWVSPHIE